ncbi:MAG: hypothetical protein ACOYMU_10200, partial [Phycisphaerales bacterium]
LGSTGLDREVVALFGTIGMIAFQIHSARLSQRISQYPSSKVGSFTFEQHLQKQDHQVTQAQDSHVRSRIV